MLSSRYGRLSSTLFDNNSRGGGGSGGGGGFLLDFTRSSSGREASNETHPAPARSVPWQNSNPPPPNLYAQVSAVHPGECYPGTGGVSIPDSSCALSLLSNEQQWTSSRSRPPTTTTISPYQNTWHGMLQSDLGLGHVQPHLATGSEVEMSRRQYMEDMEEQSRPYGSSDQHVNWSL
ncbi:Squamosa promoter-binding-like protein 9 [Linum grandiflorum]